MNQFELKGERAVKCPNCNGTGHIWKMATNELCTECNGTGEVPSIKDLVDRIEKLEKKVEELEARPPQVEVRYMGREDWNP